MYRCLLLCCASFLVVCSTQSAVADRTAAPVVIEGYPAHPTRILARAKRSAPADAQIHALEARGLTVVRTSGLVPGLMVLDIAPPVAAQAAGAIATTQSHAIQSTGGLLEHMEALRASGLYDYVEPDFLLSRRRLATDAAFADDTLWGLRNTGQSSGVVGVDVDAVRAWDITTGSSEVIVAVVDSGVRYTHSDLASQMWRNPGEVPGNSRDDDHNGYVDDVFGINAITGSGDPQDDEGHGTHVAGTIGAAANDGNPSVGVAWSVRLMACKFLSSAGTGTTSDAIECINYAAANGARIINASWGGESFSQALRDAIAALGARGVLLVTAAGNAWTDIDLHPSYPGSFDFDHIINVAAIDRRGDIAGFSNFGLRSVDLGAPGVAIYSTYHTSNTAYETMDGTSMAAPHVSGVAALVVAQFPGIAVADLRDRLIYTAVPTASLATKTLTGGRVNGYRALTMMPSGQLSVEVTPVSGTTVYHGQSFTLAARVTDLVRVRGATVSATLPGGTSVALRDDGVAPDAIAQDAVYTGTVTAPASGTALDVDVAAEAAGKVRGQVRMSYPLQSTPLNDMFAARTVISGPHGQWSGNNNGATREAGEPAHATRAGGPSVWWSWTAPADTSVTLDTLSSGFDTQLAVYTGDSLGALVQVASNDNVSDPSLAWPGGSQVTFQATGGTTYQFAVDGALGATGSIVLRLRSTIPPPNDDFADAIAIFGESATVTGSVLASTVEPGEPNGGSGSVWWNWTAPRDGTLIVGANGLGFTSDVEVYVGSTVASLTRLPGRVPENEHSWSRGWQVTCPVVAGTTYRICLAYGSGGSELYYWDATLTLRLVPGPANDLFANRVHVSGETTTITGNNTNATRELGESIDAVNAVGATVWWTWRAPRDGTLVLSGPNSAIAPQISLFTGSELATLTKVAPGGTMPQVAAWRTLTCHVQGGVDYQIAVDSDGFSESTGNIVLDLSLLATPANDLFANRILLSGTNATASGTNLGATTEYQEPEVSQNLQDATVWWAWTAPADGLLSIDLETTDHFVAVSTGTSVSALTRLRLTEWGNNNRHFSYRVAGGTQYQIAIDTYRATGPVSFVLSHQAVPANDAFANRATIAGSSVSVAGNYGGASAEPGDPVIGSRLIGSTVWWTWTAPANGVVTLTTGGPAAGVFTGSALGALTPVQDSAWELDPSTSIFYATAGTTYQIMVDGYQGASTTAFVLDLRLVDPPANDMFARRTTVSGTSLSLSADLANATSEPGEPTHGSNARTKRSLWWTWTAAANGTVLLSTTAPEYQIVFGVYTGTAVTGLTAVTNTWTGAPTKGFAFQAVAGVAYQIAVAPDTSPPPPVNWSLRLVAPLANDAFAGRVALSGTSAAANGSNIGATMESAEPAPESNSSNSASVWYTWTAPSTGTTFIRLLDTDFFPVLSVYTGNTLGGLERVQPVGGGVLVQGGLAISATAGRAYHIQVAGSYGSMGVFRLSLEHYVPAANDGFSGRSILSGNPATVTASNVGATSELNEPAHGDVGSPVATMWWTWVAPADGTAQAVAASPDFIPIVGVYRGTNVTALERVPGNHTERQTFDHLAFTVFQGVSYQVVVDGYNGGVGAFTLSVGMVDPPVNDAFARRVTLTGHHATDDGTHLGATAESGEPAHTGTGAKHSSWWTWTAPASGTVLVEVSRPVGGYSAEPAVYVGDALAGLVPVPGGISWSGSALFHADAGSVYQIAVDTMSTFGGDYLLDLDLVEAAANDMFGNRAILAGTTAAVQGTTVHAMAEPGEPGHYLAARSSVWWEWTAPSSGRVVLQVHGNGFDPVLGVYHGSTSNGLTRIDSAVAYPGDGSRATVTFDAVAGMAYEIAVDSRDAATGSFALDLAVVQPPANDRFADRIALPATGGDVVSSNRGAMAEPFDALGGARSTVWWSWTAAVNGRVLVSTAGSDFDTELWVGTGAALGQLTHVASNDDGGAGDRTSWVVFDVAAGVTYQICVGGANGSSGALRLHVEPGQIPPSPVVETPAGSFIAGRAMTLRAAGGEAPGLVYQWLCDGVAIAGATDPTYTIPVVQAFHSGSYAVRVTSIFGSSTGPAVTVSVEPPTSSTARVLNLSTRALCQTGENVLIPGFYISGAGTKRLLLRAVGPELTGFGVPGALADPQLVLRRAGETAILSSNDDWGTAGADQIRAAADSVYAFGLADGSKSAALLVDLPAGGYTIMASGKGDSTGVSIVELYEVSGGSESSRLINISNRGHVGVGGNIMIPGFVVSEEGPRTFLIRVVGPSLAPFGVQGVLLDPRLELYKRRPGTAIDDLILTNDTWGENGDAASIRQTATAVQAFGLLEASKDAAFVVTLPPGAYTVNAKGVGDTTGVALVEVYLVP